MKNKIAYFLLHIKNFATMATNYGKWGTKWKLITPVRFWLHS